MPACTKRPLASSTEYAVPTNAWGTRRMSSPVVPSNTTLATADWDRPRRKADGVNWSYRYEAVDFVQLLGVPG